MISKARLSDCGQYRYTLSRQWGGNEFNVAVFIMLNPSTADHTVDDPTIRRCIGFAKSWDLDGIRVVNLYALRSTDPKALWSHPDPVGPRNDSWLETYAVLASLNNCPIIAAWGANAKPDRVDAVLNISGMHRLSALGVTKAGQPRHPLYLKSDLIPEPWARQVVIENDRLDK